MISLMQAHIFRTVAVGAAALFMVAGDVSAAQDRRTVIDRGDFSQGHGRGGDHVRGGRAGRHDKADHRQHRGQGRGARHFGKRGFKGRAFHGRGFRGDFYGHRFGGFRGFRGRGFRGRGFGFYGIRPGGFFTHRDEFTNRAFHYYSSGRGANFGFFYGSYPFYNPYFGYGYGFGRGFYGYRPGFDYYRHGAGLRFRRAYYGGFHHHYHDFGHRHRGGHRHANVFAGALAGGVLGGFIGAEIDGGRDRSAGTVLGALSGALLGAEIARGHDRGSARGHDHRYDHEDVSDFDRGSRRYYGRIRGDDRRADGETEGICRSYRFQDGRYVCTRRDD